MCSDEGVCTLGCRWACSRSSISRWLRKPGSRLDKYFSNECQRVLLGGTTVQWKSTLVQIVVIMEAPSLRRFPGMCEIMHVCKEAFQRYVFAGMIHET